MLNSAYSDESFKATIVQPRTVAILRMCRKLIFNEFGTRLNLSQPDLIPQILEHARRSADRKLRQLASELEVIFR